MIHRLDALAPAALAGLSLPHRAAALRRRRQAAADHGIHGLRHRHRRLQHRRRRRQDDEGQIQHRRPRAAGRQRRGAAGAAAGQARAWSRRWDRAPISRRKACSNSAPRNGARSRCKCCCRRSTATPARSASPPMPASRRSRISRGKRVGFVVGSPALNQNSLAMLAFAGLKQSDVKIVEFASYGAMWKGLINNDADAAFATTITGPAKEAETSPRGLIWPPLPPRTRPDGNACRRSARSSSRMLATCGAGISPEKPIELGNYPYPIFVAYAAQPADRSTRSPRR